MCFCSVAIYIIIVAILLLHYLIVQSVSVIGVTRYEDTPPTIDHLAFPLWQWFVYAICAVIVTTATLLLMCAVSVCVCVSVCLSVGLSVCV